MAKSLSPAGQEQERELRGPLLEALGALKATEHETRLRAASVGERLEPYEKLFKEQKRDGGSVRNFRDVLAALGVSKSRAYRCRTAWHVSTVPGLLEAAEAQGIDLTEARQSKLANRIQRERVIEPRSAMNAADLLRYCIDAIASELKAGEAATVVKEPGSMPCALTLGKGTEHLIERFLKAFGNDAERMMGEWLEQQLQEVE